MSVKKVKESIYEVGVEDFDRELFDELIPLPDGTSYNAYVIKGGEKTALLDTVDTSKTDAFLKNLEDLDIDRLDYVISHHAEQDHSGSIPIILEEFPKASLVTNSRNKKMLKKHLELKNENIKVMKDGEKLSLGDRTLEFLDMPWVHWPETLVTYLEKDNILFTCDFFGSHLATSELFVEDEHKTYLAAKRYYAEIMMPFRSSIRGYLEKINDLSVDIIATSHGPIYDDPSFILDAYKEWTKEETKGEVVIPYVSMHGSTEEMVDHFVNYLISHDVKVKPYNLTTTDIGELAISLVDASTIVIGTPTVLVGPHPKALYAAQIVNALRPKTRYASLIGSYGWGGRMPDQIKDSLSNLDVEFLDGVISEGRPTKEVFSELESLADKIIEKHENDELVN